ncbi:glutaredoxin-related protein 5, mitochondrial isoform X2 [Equus przewalskii]|uniref:Glutaredoxin-related protein 5, mitochondrial isoform X2 n=1 Tax=Equus przewalskii TaxID=9798 RepID=A0ABM4MDG8_EQUPR
MSGSVGRAAAALLRWGRGAGGGGLRGPGVRAAGSGGGGGSAEQLDAMVKKDKVVVFLKGTPEQPQCGFSNAVVQILRLHGVRDYAAYNVLDDPQLRQDAWRIRLCVSCETYVHQSSSLPLTQCRVRARH